MPNHVHLLLGEKRWKVGDVMKAEPAHAQQNEQALLPSLNRSLDEDSFHALTIVASSVQRILDLRSSLLTLG